MRPPAPSSSLTKVIRSLVPWLWIVPPYSPRSGTAGNERASAVNEIGSATPSTSQRTGPISSHDSRARPRSVDAGESPSTCVTSASEIRMSPQMESSTIVPRSVPLSRGKSSSSACAVRRSSSSRSSRSPLKMGYAISRMSTVPRAVARVVAPGTLASRQVPVKFSMAKLSSGPPLPRRRPVSWPRSGTGSGPWLKRVMRSASSGVASRSTSVSVTASRGPTPQVIRPRMRERCARISICVITYSTVRASFGRVRISRCIRPRPSVGSDGSMNAMSASATESESMLIAKCSGSLRLNQKRPLPRPTEPGSRKLGESKNTVSRTTRISPRISRNAKGGSLSFTSSRATSKRIPTESGYRMRARGTSACISVQRQMRVMVSRGAESGAQGICSSTLPSRVRSCSTTVTAPNAERRRGGRFRTLRIGQIFSCVHSPPRSRRTHTTGRSAVSERRIRRPSAKSRGS